VIEIQIQFRASAMQNSILSTRLSQPFRQAHISRSRLSQAAVRKPSQLTVRANLFESAINGCGVGRCSRTCWHCSRIWTC